MTKLLLSILSSIVVVMIVCLLRSQAVVSCPSRTMAPLASSAVGVAEAYGELESASTREQALILVAYHHRNCGVDRGSLSDQLVRSVDFVVLMIVSPLVSLEAAFLLTRLQAKE